MAEPFESIAVNANDVPNTSIQIPGATPNGLDVQLLNVVASHGIVATIIRFEAGAHVPAHSHESGAEAHYVLEGDLVDAGRTFGPGAYLTHAANVVHGPHSSVGGCRILTVRSTDFGIDDHHVADENGAPASDKPIADPEPEAPSPDGVPAADRSAATPDNPINPNSG